MLTRNDLRAVLIEALQGAADGLRNHMEATPPAPPLVQPEAVVVDPVNRSKSPTEDDPVAFGDRLLVSITEAAKALGVGRTGVYNLISSGELVTVTIGRRRLVPVVALKEYVLRLR